jgi:hypothetical protein
MDVYVFHAANIRVSGSGSTGGASVRGWRVKNRRRQADLYEIILFLRAWMFPADRLPSFINTLLLYVEK